MVTTVELGQHFIAPLSIERDNQLKSLLGFVAARRCTSARDESKVAVLVILWRAKWTGIHISRIFSFETCQGSLHVGKASQLLGSTTCHTLDNKVLQLAPHPLYHILRHYKDTSIG